ncbi:MAG: hypothetical protein ACRDXX_02145 [Stackebrandtia sp.]
MSADELEATPEPADSSRPLVREVFGGFLDELVALLRQAGEDDLAVQAWDLRIFAPCECESPECHSFYTAQPPQGRWREGHRNVVVDTANSMIVLDVVHERIMLVEVLLMT